MTGFWCITCFKKYLGLDRVQNCGIIEVMDKRESEMRHAARRAKERYGMRVTRVELNWLASEIIAGRSKFIRKVSNTRSVHELMLREKLVRVVYDSLKLRKCIVTFLHTR